MPKCNVCGKGRPRRLTCRMAEQNLARVFHSTVVMATYASRPAERDGLTADEAALLKRNIEHLKRLEQSGRIYCSQLHSVVHDPGYPGVNYAAIQDWLGETESIAASLAYTPEQWLALYLELVEQGEVEPILDI